MHIKKENLLKSLNTALLIAAPLFLMFDRLILMTFMENCLPNANQSSILFDAITFYIIFVIFILINYLLYEQKSKAHILCLLAEIAIIVIFLYPVNSFIYIQNIFLTLFWSIVIINNIIYYLLNMLESKPVTKK